MPMYNIDDFDLKILTLLQSNGRLTNQELSELIGLSASQCSRRRIALEQAQLILGYHARLAPDAVGQEMLGLIEVRLLNHTPECVASFHQMVSGVDAILDAYKTTGDNDYLLKVAVSDLPGLNHVISGILAQNKSVAHLKTSVVLHRLKENGLSMPGSNTLP
ncbi:DNA-binding transcriptional regulator, Lrp family [Kosakonia oryzendophytica]|uniref:DNA-binding transcriptional regulator, Lrp family n=2 Tax=Enterobacteriaceae TaxID=543 RepID=A0A1C4DX68_9ENTR|nr:DNA-binding transcriptional regulator, Lrp family [Kosakonia oryzendophytica]